jgi:hypothetical protein
MCTTKRLSTRRQSPRQIALDKLRADAAVQSADPRAREWLLALLEHRPERPAESSAGDGKDSH